MSAQTLQRVLARVPTPELLAALAERKVDTERANRCTEILARIAADTGLRPVDILSETRTHDVVVARWRLYNALRECGYTTAAIAAATGHTQDRIRYAFEQTAAHA